MAFSLGNGGGGRRNRGHYGAMSEINVVPLVDVVLVLLIIFMLTAHVMEFGLEVDVPKVKQVRETVEDLPVITISRTGETYLGEKPTNLNLLAEEVRRQYPKTAAVFLRADKNTIWDPIAQVISKLGEAKLEVKVVTTLEEDTPKGRR
jgi:biopolymer transport protein ExbD